MNLNDKIQIITETIKWKVEDILFSLKNKGLDLVEFVRYDVFKQNLPELDFDFGSDVEEPKKPKKKKKNKTKKKKK